MSPLLSHCPHHESTYTLGPLGCPGSPAHTCQAHKCPFRAYKTHQQPFTYWSLSTSTSSSMWNRFTGSLNPAPSIIYSSLAIHQIFILPMHFPAWTCHYEGRSKGWGITAPGNSALPEYYQIPSLLFLASWLLNPVISCLPPLYHPSLKPFSPSIRDVKGCGSKVQKGLWVFWPYRVSNLLINLMNLPMSSGLYLLCFYKFSENMFMMEFAVHAPTEKAECTS